VPQPRSAWVSRRTEPEHERFLLSDPTHHVGHDRHQDTDAAADHLDVNFVELLHSQGSVPLVLPAR
jgi:hypothetical protein